MFRVCSTALSFVLLAGAVFADGPARRERPPPDYSRRVQMYDTPVSVAPPKPADIPDEHNAMEPAAPSLPGATRSPLTLIQPDVPGVDGMMERSTSGRTRDPLAGLRGDAVSNKTGSGWGWLADGITSNLSSRNTRQSQDEITPDGQRTDDPNSSDSQTNWMSSTRDAQGANSVSNDSSSRAIISEPALGWISDSQGDAQQQQSEVSLLPDPNTLDVVQQEAAQSRDWSSQTSYGVWDAASVFNADIGAAPSLFDIGIPTPAPTPREVVRDVPEPTRVAAPDTRFSDAGRFKIEDSAGLFSGASSPATDFGSFTPFAMGPVDTPSIDIQPASVSLPALPDGSSSASSSLGGMGTDRERDRAIPKTLPW